MSLVTGGYSNDEFISSTELLEDGSSEWVEASPLPLPRGGLRGVNIGNKLFVTGQLHPIKVHIIVAYLFQLPTAGGRDRITSFSDILEFMSDTKEWVKSGDLQTARGYHGISTIEWNYIEGFCT